DQFTMGDCSCSNAALSPSKCRYKQETDLLKSETELRALFCRIRNEHDGRIEILPWSTDQSSIKCDISMSDKIYSGDVEAIWSRQMQVEGHSYGYVDTT
ncbi:hypothetical protein, partial [Ralstonia pseudosolanacearum]|uniref:hypothetical protein n=1 Tax=Ralstonia pseudosolanacearum TaxID=1310165 RepID=UPI003CE8EAE6